MDNNVGFDSDNSDVMRENTERVCRILSGKRKDEAKEIIRSAGLSLRFVEIDGQPIACTSDFRLDRINLHLKNGIVVKATAG